MAVKRFGGGRAASLSGPEFAGDVGGTSVRRAERLDRLSWRVSSYTGNTGNCVEVAALPGGGRVVRDTKNRDGDVVAVDASQWARFLAKVKGGALDL